jgi:hypothetical protein
MGGSMVDELLVRGGGDEHSWLEVKCEAGSHVRS